MLPRCFRIDARPKLEPHSKRPTEGGLGQVRSPSRSTRALGCPWKDRVPCNGLLLPKKYANKAILNAREK